MTKRLDWKFKSPIGIAHCYESASPSVGGCETSAAEREARLVSSQRGREVSKVLQPTDRQGSSSCRVCGATFDENIPLSGGASAGGAGVGYAFLGKPTPSAYGSHPSKGGDCQRRLSSISSRLGLRILVACLWMLLFAPSSEALAQAKRTDKPAEEPASTKPQVSSERQQHAQKVFTIKHGDVNAIAQTLRIYPVDVRPNRELQVIGVSAPAALMPTIEDTIRRLDVSPAPPVPPPAPKNVELTVYLLLASDQEASAGSVPPDLESVVKQLQVTFAFKHFRTVDTLVVRSRDRYGASVNGIARFESDVPHSSTYGFGYKAASVSSDEKGRSIRLDGLRFSARIVTRQDGAGVPVESSAAGFGTDLDVREGQKVVVGKTAVGGTNTALILVITAKVLE